MSLKDEELETEREIQKSILIRISVLFILSVIQHTFPKQPINDPSIWFFVWMFTLWCLWRVWLYFRWRSAVYLNFQGWKYSATLGLAVLGVIGVFMLGAIPMYLRLSDQGKIGMLSVYLSIFLLPVIGFGWTEIWERYKDPYQFLAKYCLGVQAIILTIILSTTIVGTVGSSTLFELILEHRSDFTIVKIYILISFLLFCIYMTPLGNNLWFRRLSALLALANFLLCFQIMIEFEEDIIGVGLILTSFFLSASGLFPQLYWVFSSRK